MKYITTPIYYVNDEPHLGHAYSTTLADALARYYRLFGEQVFFLTGVSEHGQKVFNAARQNGFEDPHGFVDAVSGRFQAAWERLRIRPDDFIRTTEPRHVRVVQHMLQRLWDAGQIYRGEYEGWYCVPDERFWTEKDLRLGDDGAPLCPDCARPVEKIVEHNYFFRMSAYQDWLLEYVQDHPEFIQPAFRRNEVLGFLRRPLGDLCISRPIARLSWGVPLPFDPDYVTYVWFDELLNYVTAAGWLDDPARFERQWPEAVHLIGKDILTPHAVYWSTMLHAAGLPLPRTIFAHGWWTVNGQKMGKSLGNAIRPLDLAGIYGADAFRYFVLREMAPGQDADFNYERMHERYQVDLANNLGNLLQRVTAMTARYCAGSLPAPAESGAEEAELRQRVEALAGQVLEQVREFALHNALALCFDALTAVNAYLERTAPWLAAKSGDTARVGTILYTAAEALRLVSVLLAPVLPEKTGEIWQRLGWDPARLSQGLAWGALAPGSPVTTGAPLFPREVEAPGLAVSSRAAE